MPEEKEIDKIKKLSARERIKQLEELQKKAKEEIEAAQKLLAESKEEAAREEELEKIPVPQLKAVDIEALFTREERELFKAKRYAEERRKEETSEEAPTLETVAEEAPEIAEERRQAQMRQYALAEQFSRTPAQEIYNRVREIYREFKETGRVTREQMQELNAVHYANIDKLDDIRTGRYLASREVAERMVASERMRAWLQNQYKPIDYQRSRRDEEEEGYY